MRLVYVDSSRLPTKRAHGIQIMKMCEAFARSGVAVELVVPWRRNKVKADPFAFYQVESNFRLTRLPTLDISNLVPKWGSRIASSIFLTLVKGYLLFRPYHVLYLREKFSGLFFKDYVMEVHTLPEKVSTSDKHVWQKAKKIISITSFLRDRLVSLGIHPEKILVAPDGVDLQKFKVQSSKFKVRKELGLPTDKQIVMYTGHLYEWKGVDVLLGTAKQLSISPPTGDLLKGDNYQFPILFVFVGGLPREVGQFQAKAKGLQNVLILGHRPHGEIPKYLAAADVLVLPNSAKPAISKFYTSPLKLFEYLAAGRPIVAADLPSLREILDEETAVFFAADDRASLLAVIKKLLADEKLQERLARNGWQKVQQFSWGARARRILAFINQ